MLVGDEGDVGVAGMIGEQRDHRIAVDGLHPEVGTWRGVGDRQRLDPGAKRRMRRHPVSCRRGIGCHGQLQSTTAFGAVAPEPSERRYVEVVSGHDPNARHQRRLVMVREQLEARGIANTGVLDAMGEVPRERFVPDRLAPRAYNDEPLPISEGQTISQPYIVAAMIDSALVGPTDRVLEVGTGSGYGAAVLSRVVAEVVSVERHPSLSETAAVRLNALGYDNVEVVVGDGSLGYAERAPYGAVIVTAAGPGVPRALVEQLAEGGRLVMPIERAANDQHLIRATLRDGLLGEEDLGAVRFVPLIGAQGWPAQASTRTRAR